MDTQVFFHLTCEGFKGQSFAFPLPPTPTTHEKYSEMPLPRGAKTAEPHHHWPGGGEGSSLCDVTGIRTGWMRGVRSSLLRGLAAPTPVLPSRSAIGGVNLDGSLRNPGEGQGQGQGVQCPDHWHLLSE